MSHSLVDSSLYINESPPSDQSLGSHSDITYEKLSENHYIVRTDERSYELDRKELINTLNKLHKHAHEFVPQLNKEFHDLLTSTIEATRILYNSKALKNLILDDIKSIYHDIKNPVPGTVGAFFIGCFNDDNFKGPIGCNPRCAASLFGCHNEQIECSDTVLIFSHGQFTYLNDKKTLHCFIYIEDCHFTTFSNHHVQKLKQAGHDEVTMIYTNEDGSFKHVTDRLQLHGLTTNNDSESSPVWIGLIVIFVIIIILILLALLYWYNNKYKFFI
jgi:hypothetical protein